MEDVAPEAPAPKILRSPYPCTTLLSTRSHPTAPTSIQCSPSHTLAFLTPTLLTFLSLPSLSPPASFLSSTSPLSSHLSSLSSPLSPLTFSSTALPSPSPPASPPSPSLPSRSAHLDVDPSPTVPLPPLFLSGRWAPTPRPLYAAVTSAGRAVLLLVAASSVTPVAELSGGRGAHQGWDALQHECVTSVALTCAGEGEALYAAVGTKGGSVTVWRVALPVQEPARVELHHVLQASAEYVTEVAFSPDQAAEALRLAVGDAAGVTQLWTVHGSAGASATSSSRSLPALPSTTHDVPVVLPSVIEDAPVGILAWCTVPPRAAPAGGAEDSDDGHETCPHRGPHYILTTSASSRVSVHRFHAGGVLCASYHLADVHGRHITSLIFSQDRDRTFLISSSASGSVHRHLLTSTSAVPYSHYQPSPGPASPSPITLPLTSQFGLCASADGLLLMSVRVQVVASLSIKRRERRRVVTIHAWPLAPPDPPAWAGPLPSTGKKRKRDDVTAAEEVASAGSARLEQQTAVIDAFVQRCATGDGGAGRCAYSMGVHLTALLSPLALLASLYEPPLPSSTAPHTGRIPALDAAIAYVERSLAEPKLPSAHSLRRTLHFLLCFARDHSASASQFTPLSAAQRASAIAMKRQLEHAMLEAHSKSAASQLHAPLVGAALRVLSAETDLSFDTGETCALCGEAVPFTSVEMGTCSAGHTARRDKATLRLMDPVQLCWWECAQCRGRFGPQHAHRPCWQCDVTLHRAG